MTTTQFFRLVNFEVVQNCFDAINKALANTAKTVVVTIGADDDKARTHAQNRLYWLWVAYIADKLGNDKDYQHRLCKRELLARIYARDDGAFAQMADSVARCKRHLTHAEYEAMAMGVATLISTTTATSAQFTEYLQDIERWAYARGILLPQPQELMWVVR